MRGKITLLAGIGIGYVLGARAGRERYEEIKRAASRFWNSPRVTRQVRNVEQFAKDKAPDVVDFIGDTAKKVIQRSPADSAKTSTPAKKATTTSSSKSATKSGAKPKKSSTASSTSSKK